MAGRIARFLSFCLGLERGDRAAIVMKNCTAYYEVLYGIWYAGMVAVPVNAKLHADEFAYIINDSGARVAFADHDLAGALAPIASGGGLERVIAVHTREYAAIDRLEPAPLVHRPGIEPAWLFYTSGTTGRPKGATLTHRNLLMMTMSYFADIDPISPLDAILHAAPMSHGSGLYGLPHVAKAANNVIPESDGYDPNEIFYLWRRHRGVSMFAAPTMVIRLLNEVAGPVDTSNLKLICYGGGPMYVADTLRALEVFGPNLVQIFGQGESPMTITYLAREIHADLTHPRFQERLGSVGIARTDIEFRVVDAEDRCLPVGETGEVVVRGEVVMAGYWRNPEATAETLRGGWLHTGDLGSVDEDGFLTLKDRSKDLIISGGTNIYPREVEEVLLRHPAVLEAAVVGRPHRQWGEEVVAFVVVRPGHSTTSDALDELCIKHMGRFKRPRSYVFEPSLPKNNYGKVLKRSLRERLRASARLG
jgi:acyl-CoA synthetase (AMP-forming)/AMP-acid ligase II